MDANVITDTTQRQVWLDYATGVAWGSVALFFGVIFSYAAMITGVATETLGLIPAMLIATLLLYIAFTVLHDAGHGSIAHEVTWMKPVERFMGWSLSLLFLLLPFGLFARLHDYHHAFTNDPDRDPDHWIDGDSWLSATPRAFTIVLRYVYLTATQFRRDPVIAQTHTGSLIYYSCSLSIIAGLVIAGYGLEVLMVGIIPAFFSSYILGMLFDWIPHTPTRQQTRYQNTRSYLFPGAKLITLGQNYHHIHHLYPRVAWYHYDKVFAQIRPELERQQAPIEALFSSELPGLGQSPYARQPSSIDGLHKMTLDVARITQETEDAVVITFANLNGKPLPFKAGQYITLSKRIDGQDITRCYSICEPPSAGTLSVGVKRVDKGVFSNYLNQQLAVGDQLTVAGPFGDFIFDPSTHPSGQALTLIAAGSGITPIMSILSCALAAGVKSNLVYLSRSPAQALFNQQLYNLSRQYPQLLQLTEVYTHSPSGSGTQSGHLTAEQLTSILSADTQPQAARYYICGPEGLKQLAMDCLHSLGVDTQHILTERFTQAESEPSGVLHQVKISMADGSSHSLQVAENQTLVQAANQQGINLPYACGIGQCGSCMLQVTEGESELVSEQPPGLLPGEQASGFTLACQCRPKSDLSLQQV